MAFKSKLLGITYPSDRALCFCLCAEAQAVADQLCRFLVDLAQLCKLFVALVASCAKCYVPVGFYMVKI